ncbi:hypothetical protein ES708_16594 [subsurface metagenome]
MKMVKITAEIPAETFKWIRDKYRSKGQRSLLLEWHIEKVCKTYSRLTVRMLFYRLCARFGYAATKIFIKKLFTTAKK